MKIIIMLVLAISLASQCFAMDWETKRALDEISNSIDEYNYGNAALVRHS